MYPDGYHVHNYPSGSRYEGGWKGGRKHGQGTYTYAGGGKYVGEFVDDKRHGQGAYTCESPLCVCVCGSVCLSVCLALADSDTMVRGLCVSMCTQNVARPLRVCVHTSFL